MHHISKILQLRLVLCIIYIRHYCWDFGLLSTASINYDYQTENCLSYKCNESSHGQTVPVRSSAKSAELPVSEVFSRVAFVFGLSKAQRLGRVVRTNALVVIVRVRFRASHVGSSGTDATRLQWDATLATHTVYYIKFACYQVTAWCLLTRVTSITYVWQVRPAQ